MDSIRRVCARTDTVSYLGMQGGARGNEPVHGCACHTGEPGRCARGLVCEADGEEAIEGGRGCEEGAGLSFWVHAGSLSQKRGCGVWANIDGHGIRRLDVQGVYYCEGVELDSFFLAGACYEELNCTRLRQKINRERKPELHDPMGRNKYTGPNIGT